MKLKITHKTNYIYSEQLLRSTQILRLTPQQNHHQNVIEWHIDAPEKTFKTVDWYGNVCESLVIDAEYVNKLQIIAHGTVETNNISVNSLLGDLPLEYYLNQTSYTRYAAAMDSLIENVNVIDLATIHKISENVIASVPYITGATNSATTAEDALKLKAGVCQDHSHIMLALMRHLKLPARYVSGYLFTADTEHVASHAWIEVWLENCWYSFDISNQCLAGESHVILAYGLDYTDASPIRGCRIGGGVENLNTLASVICQ